MNPMRVTRRAALFCIADMAGTIASSSGSANAAPTPLRNLRHGPDKSVGIAQEHVSQSGRTVELHAVGKGHRCVDWNKRLVNLAPAPHHVKIFERQSQRIHHRMTAGACRVRAMLSNAKS